MLEALEKYLRAHNGLVKTFEFAGKVQKRMEEEAAATGEVVERVGVVVNPHRQGFRVTDR